MKEMIKYCDILANEVAKDKAVMGFVYAPLGILSMMGGAEKVFGIV